MKVCQVISSDLPILPTGKRRWGAVELIMSEYKKHLNKINVDVDFKYLNDIKPDDYYNIVHIHVANLCIEAKKRGIEYVYSNHDHTSVYYGKGSWLYKQQLEAIKGSVFSICHAESVMSFFDETDKLFYLPHGVDMDYYTSSPLESRKNGLLMVATNGMAGDYGIDRKGFRLGIEAAKKLNMPITIVGSEANEKFFDIHSDLAKCPLVNIVSSNPTEEEKRNYYQNHSIFIHPSYLEFGSPNLTLLEAWSCNLPMVAAYDGRTKFEGMSVLNALNVDEICEKVKYILDNYESIVNAMNTFRTYKHDWSSVVNQLINMYWAASDNLFFPSYGSSFVQKKYRSVYA